MKNNYRVQDLKCCKICKHRHRYVYDKDLCCNLDKTKPDYPQLETIELLKRYEDEVELLKQWEVTHEVDWKGVCDDYEDYEVSE